MKRIFGLTFLVTILSLSVAVSASAQSSKKNSPVAEAYVITAKAGGVNFVSGNVSVYRRNKTTTLLIKGSQLETGDEVKSAADGKAEILLNPGSFVRLAPDSALFFVSNSLDDLQVKVARGSAIFEVVATKDFKIDVTTPQSGFSIIKSGIYRVDVAESGVAKIEVWKGKAQLNGSTTAVLKGGQTSALDAGQVAVVKFDRDDKDDFELWSKVRAKELAKLNDALLSRQMNRSLISYSNAFDASSYSPRGGFGLWVQDPLSRSYCFLPYGYGYNSPYGYGYNRSVWSSQSPQNPYNNQNNAYNAQQPYNPSNNSQNNGNSMPNQPMNQNNGNPMMSPPSMNSSPARSAEPMQPNVQRPMMNKAAPLVD